MAYSNWEGSENYKMKKILKNDAKTAVYLDSLPTIYLVGCWASYGVMDFKWIGKYVKNKRSTGQMEPLVWHFNDHNGTCERWYLVPIHLVTTGEIICWTEDKKVATKIANALNTSEEVKSSRL